MCIKGCVYTLTALIDTGTHIEDCINGYSVIIAQKNAFDNLDGCALTYLPYKSLGKDNGILPAVYGQWVEVNKKKTAPVIIGLYNNKFSDTFNAIVSPELIGGEYDETV